jgi:hypothetical protein
MTSILERFMAKVEKTEGCWNWTASLDKCGYGRFNINGKILKAHRVAYTLFIGDVPEGRCVCHTCDHPGCVNPEHLWLGTVLENMQDRDRKGRAVHPISKGEANGNAKLSQDDIVKIREMRSYGYLQREIAQSFGVSLAQISRIILGQRWEV